LESLLGDAAKEEEKALYTMGCRVLETTAMEFFASYGWWFSNRLPFI